MMELGVVLAWKRAKLPHQLALATGHCTRGFWITVLLSRHTEEIGIYRRT